MANKKAEERGIRKLTKIGMKSFAVTLPVEFIRQLGWRERQKLKVTRIKGGIQIRDYRGK